jgi:hypothetical protein
MKNFNRSIVITGCGIHSKDGPKLKNSIEEFLELEEYDYELDENDAGYLVTITN